MDTISRSEPQQPEPRSEARSTTPLRRVKRIPRAWLPPSRRRSWTAQASLLVGSAAIAFGVVEAINSWLFSGRALSVETDVVGYPTAHAFNIAHYYQMFFLAVAAFPVVFGLSYVVLARLVPMLVLRYDSRALVVGSGMVGRLALPGVALGLVAAVAAHAEGGRQLATLVVLVALGYALAVAVAARVLSGVRPARGFDHWLAVANTLAVPVTVASMAVVSAATTVTLLKAPGGKTVVSWSWLPWPVALAGTLAVLGVLAWNVRRQAGGTLEQARRLEYRAVALVAGSVITYLLTAELAGAKGPVDVFHEGEQLGTATLFGKGYFPWRDVLFIHGPLLDGLWPSLGLHLFEDSRWGMHAGLSVIVYPMCFVLIWVLLALTVRNWVVLGGYLVVLLAGESLFGGVLLPATSLPRMAFLPLAVLLLLRTIKAQDRRAAFGLGVLLLVLFVLTPELSFGIVSAVVALVGYELTAGRGVAWARRFPLTLWCGAGGAVAAAVVAAWLALNGALDDFVYYFVTFAPDHNLTGAFPVNLPIQGEEYIFAAVLPFALALLTGAYFAWRLATRGPLLAADWAMGSLAVLGLLMYPKFLARADTHVLMGVVLGLPLLVYVVARILEPGDRDIESAAPGRAPRHVLSLAVLGALLLGALPDAVGNLGDVPDRLRPVVASDNDVPKLGYATPDAQEIGDVVADLKTTLAALGPKTRIFDFTNQPALITYFLGAESTTRYFHVSMAIRETNQADLIDELAADPPEVALYWSTTYGLSGWDGIANPVRHYDVSQWLLDHYRPWVAVDGEILYLRNDIDPPPLAAFAGDLGSEPVTEGLSSVMPQCGWGYAPQYLPAEQQAGTDGVTLEATELDRVAHVTGVAGPVAGQPARTVLAVSPEGRVWAGTPVIEGGGFLLDVGLAPGEQAEALRLVAVSGSEAVPLTADGPALPAGTTLRYSEGAKAVTTGHPGDGTLVSVDVQPLESKDHVSRLELPAGATQDYDWVEVLGAAGLKRGNLSLSDSFTAPLPRLITFSVTGGPVDRYLVQAASCPQWDVFTGDTLYLRSTRQDAPQISLQRSTGTLGER